jgi:hypothetical protein
MPSQRGRPRGVRGAICGMLGPMVCPISAFSRGHGSMVLVLALAMGPATGCGDDVPTSSGDGSSTTGVATGTTGGPTTVTVGSADDTVGTTSGSSGSTGTASSGEPGTESSGSSSGGTTQGVSATDGSSSSDGTTSGGSTTDATTSGGSTTAATTDATTDFTSSGGMTSGATDFGSTSGDPSGTTDGDTGTMVDVPDFSGDFLFVMATPLDPTLPFQYVANFDYVPSGVGGGTVDVELQPLALDTGSTTTPRTFFGPPLVFPGIPVAPDGTFAVPVGVLDVAAETNPLFFIDAQAINVNLSVQVLDADALCGTVTGSLVFPVASSLDGTTLAAVRVLDVMPAGLPVVFPVACP